MKKWICVICGYVYDESKLGKFEDLPADWSCPDCGAEKASFEVMDE